MEQLLPAISGRSGSGSHICVTGNKTTTFGLFITSFLLKCVAYCVVRIRNTLRVFTVFSLKHYPLKLWIELIHICIQYNAQDAPNATHQKITKYKPQKEGHRATVAFNSTIFENEPLDKKTNENGRP